MPETTDPDHFVTYQLSFMRQNPPAAASVWFFPVKSRKRTAALEKTNDPVRMYLREVGTVPLLAREGEVEISKRIEREQLRVLKVSGCPIVP